MRAVSGRTFSRAAIGLALASVFGGAAIAAETAPIPDFSGVIWGRNWLFFEPPPTGQGPVLGRPRTGNGQPLVGNFNNPLLKPEAAEILKKRGEISLGGAVIPDPVNQCQPEPTPYTVGAQFGMQILQEKDKVTLLYIGDHKARHVYLNVPHPKNVTPSWQGHSVGHYEGDTLVIDTVGQKVGPFSMVDLFGTPFSPALHVIERYRLIDGVTAAAAVKKHVGNYIPGGSASYIIGEYGRGLIDPDTSRKAMQIEVRVEDPGVFTAPWSAFVTYQPAGGRWPEAVCAENYLIGVNKEVLMPRAEKADF